VKPDVIAASDEACGPPRENPGPGSARPIAGAGTLLEAALTRENLKAAWKRVKANKGAAGVDGLDIVLAGAGTCPTAALGGSAASACAAVGPSARVRSGLRHQPASRGRVHTVRRAFSIH
jgi:hypothetical protein